MAGLTPCTHFACAFKTSSQKDRPLRGHFAKTTHSPAACIASAEATGETRDCPGCVSEAKTRIRSVVKKELEAAQPLSWLLDLERFLATPQVETSADGQNLPRQMRRCGEYFRCQLKTIVNDQITEYKAAESITERFELHEPGHTVKLLPAALRVFFVSLLGQNQNEESINEDPDCSTSTDSVMATEPASEDDTEDDTEEDTDESDASDADDADDADDEKDYPSPALLAVASICLKAVRRTFVSPYAWRVAVYLNSRGKLNSTRLLNRTMISASYSFLQKAKEELTRLREDTFQETANFARGSSGVLSSDNIQKQSTPSTAGREAQAKIVIVTSTAFRRIPGDEDDDIQAQPPGWSFSDVKPASNFMDLTMSDRRQVLEFLESDHQSNLQGSDRVKMKRSRISTPRRQRILDTTRILPCSDVNPASQEAMAQMCELYEKFMSASGKKWIWVATDGGPMMSLLKLQRENPGGYDRLHPIVGALHEEMCYLETVCILLHTVGILQPARRGRLQWLSIVLSFVF